MINQGNFIVVLDACVLYKANIRDLLLRIAKNELYQPKWSNTICEEVRKNLTISAGVSTEKAQRLIDIINKAFPEALTANYKDLELLNPVEINEKDRHVLSTAIISNSQVIVTDNIKDFPNNILEKYNLEAQSSDIFLQNLLDLSPEGVVASYLEMENSLKNPPIPRNKILEGLIKQVPVFTDQLKEFLN